MEASTAQQQQPTQAEQEQAVLAALTVILLAGLPTAAALSQALPLFGMLGIGRDAAEPALQLALGSVIRYPTGGPATSHTRRGGVPRRAAYTLAAARRLASGRDVQAERRYLAQHLAAERARVEAAGRVDRAAMQFGLLLGWQSLLDEVTTPACRAASGRNFTADHPPTLPRIEEGHQLTGYPGTLHGGACRCLPTRPFPDAPLLA